MINTNNISLRDAAFNTSNPTGGGNTYKLETVASFLGRKRPGAAWNNATNYWADEDYELWHLGSVALMQSGTGNIGSYLRTLINGSSQNYQYKWYAAVAGTYRIYPYYDNTAYYKNGTLQGNVNQGGFADVVCAANDYFSATQPIAVYCTTNPELEPAFSGWSGYKFASRVDRYQANTFYVYSTLDTVANITAYGITNFDQPVTNAASIASTTNLGVNQVWTFNSTTSIQGILIESSEPICVVAMGTSTRDVRRLYPMTNNDKFGVFSSGGHIISVANYDNGSVTATLVGYGSNSTSTSNFSIAYNPGSLGGTNYYADSAAGPTGGSNFTGPAVRLIDTTGKSLFMAESQGDGDGSEMTTFVDMNFMADQTWCYLPAASDWGGVVATGATTSNFVHQWSSATWKTRSWRFTQANALQDVQYAYMTSMVNSTNAPPLFESEAPNNVFYWDKAGQYEDNQFPSDGTDFTKGTPAQWPNITITQQPYGTPFNALDPWIQEICAGASPTAIAYGDGGDATTSQYMYSNTSQGNWIRDNSYSGQTIFFVQNIGGGNPVYKIENPSSTDDVMTYEHVNVGTCEGEGGAPKSDRRLKENITQINTSTSGIPVYTFNYIGDSDLYKGVMAQDLIELGFEDAVGMGNDGYYFVRYDMIDVDMEKL